MPHYMISYLGGKQPSSPEEGQKHFAKYKEWLAALGDAAISPANPLKNTHTIKADGTVETSSSTSMSGYTLIKTDSLEMALTIAKACPFLELDGCLEVSEVIQMSI